MLPSCVLQHQSIFVHRTLLGCIVPGFRPYEDGMRPDVGVAAVRFRDDIEKHIRDGSCHCWDGGV